MFPGATDGDPADATYTITGAPLDRSTSFYPGTRFGPEQIRHFAHGFEDYDHYTDQSFTALDVVDCGDVRGWQDAPAYLDFLAGELRDAGGISVLLGGEHTVSIAGVKASEPDLYVCLDAHLDLRESFDGDPWSHATATHHVLDDVDEIVLIGARAGSSDEWDRAATDDRITLIEVAEAESQAPDVDVTGRDVYLSIDIDALDPSVAPATGTREPFGLSPHTVRAIVQSVAPSVVGADIVEVNDRDAGQTATLAAKLVRRLIFTHAAAHT